MSPTSRSFFDEWPVIQQRICHPFDNKRTPQQSRSPAGATNGACGSVAGPEELKSSCRTLSRGSKSDHKSPAPNAPTVVTEPSDRTAQLSRDPLSLSTHERGADHDVPKGFKGRLFGVWSMKGKTTRRGSKGEGKRTAAVVPGVVDRVVETLGSLKTVLGTFSTAYAKHEEFPTISNMIGAILSRITALEVHFAHPLSDVAKEERLKELSSKLGDIEPRLRSLSETLAPLHLANCIQDVFRLLGDLQEGIVDYQVAQETATSHLRNKLIDPAEKCAVNNIRRAHGAGFLPGGRNGCLNGTREAVLGEVELWMKSFDKSPVFWLNGLAGTGKSAIAQTVAERAFASGQLGASFFCSRDFEDRSSLKHIFPTLAFQLAHAHPQFRSRLVRVVQSDPQVTLESLYNQMDKLLVGPLKSSGISTVIIIDALDECKDEQPASAVLSVLGRFVAEIPKVKFFVTGRPEPRIQSGFRLPLMAKATDVFVLHEVEPNRVSSDIRLFLKHSLAKFADRQGRSNGWLAEGHLDVLCKSAGGLFVYAAAIVKFLDHKDSSPQERLDLLLKSPEGSARGGGTNLERYTLDSLYMTILQEAFKEASIDNEQKFRSVLGAVVLVESPLPPSAIGMLLDIDIDLVLSFLSSIQSLLIFHNDSAQPVRPFHKSFPDFITDPTRCLSERFHLSIPDHQTELLMSCLELMNKGLERNTCRLPDLVTNAQVPDLQNRVERHINPSLQYACRSWHKHLVGARWAPRCASITSALRRFLEEKFIFYLETLSVLGAVRDAVHALNTTKKWLKEIGARQCAEMVDDCLRFVTGFFDIISESSTHISHSALVLAPGASITRKLYGQDAHCFVKVMWGGSSSWDLSTASTMRPSGIEAITWSPSGQFLVVAGSGSTAEILSPVTLERLYTVNSPPGAKVFAFSPDNRSLSCSGTSPGPLSSFVATWDLQTGGIVGVRASELRTDGHPSSLAYSNDGQAVAIGFTGGSSPDTFTIEVYDVGSCALMRSCPLEGVFAGIWTHGKFVRTAAVLPTGEAVVYDIPIDSGHDGDILTKELNLPFSPTATEPILFLPDPLRASYVQGGSITIWDIQTAKTLLLVQNVDFKGSTISFSPDGSFFACGTIGLDVYLWRYSGNGYELHRKLSSVVTSPNLLFSPDSTSVITWDRSTVQLWPLEDSVTSTSDESLQNPGGRHQFTFAFSPDRRLAAFARLQDSDTTVTVIEPESGYQRAVFDVGMGVCSLRVTEDTVVVEGASELIYFDLCKREDPISAEVGEGSPRTKRTRALLKPAGGIGSTLVSPDLRLLARTYPWPNSQVPFKLDIYDAESGELLRSSPTKFGTPWFSLKEGHIWCGGETGEEGWQISRVSGSANIELVPLTGDLAEDPPWRSSRRCTITNDGWIRNPEGEELMWLPPRWRSDEKMTRMWSGDFLVLLHSTLPKPVVMKLLE